MQPFFFINNNNISNRSISNLFLSKYKENYSYDGECRMNLPKSEDVLCGFGSIMDPWIGTPESGSGHPNLDLTPGQDPYTRSRTV